MARIGGVDLPNEKRIEIALRYIYGVGPFLAKRILEEASIDESTKAKDLTQDQTVAVREAIKNLGILTEGDLRKEVSMNIKREIDNNTYRGSRHRKNLPVRGQRTSTNARTKRGKRKTVGGKKKEPAKT